MVNRPPATRGAFPVWRAVTTRWADNDAYGHVNNTVYYQWFDSAVNAWLVEQGLLDITVGDPTRSCPNHAATRAMTFPQPSLSGCVAELALEPSLCLVCSPPARTNRGASEFSTSWSPCAPRPCRS